MNERARRMAQRRAVQLKKLQARPRIAPGEQLVPLARAARTLGVTEDSLTNWHKEGACPIVRTPGRTRFTYGTWLNAVMTCARPGIVGDMKSVTDAWWDEHFPGVREEVAA
jgi:hypothetical protein